jgi:hypothetical protein
VISSWPLRPNQRVRLALPQTERPIRLGASVQWANFEMPGGGPSYRAGLRFLNADVPAIERFIATNRRSPP